MRAVTAGAMRDAYLECVVQKFDVACSMFDFDDNDDDDCEG